MKILGLYNRHILVSVVTLLFLSSAAFVLLLFLGWWVRMMREGVAAEQFLEASPYFVIMAVPTVLPIAFVVAVSSVVSRVAFQNELLALSSSGVPLRSITVPLYFVAVLLS
ncbi:MAG: LptF/LptG family permease, partial [Planctomycetota bacterium]|nr:LptF/LptG family permease [Planctomycetota bacterium]